jgi:xanthine dehydrogenase accessory factor
VACTQGEGDEEALEAALNTGAAYVALVASKKKAGKLLDHMKERGLDVEKMNRVRAPAGLDIGASSPEEIAVSILAEIVQARKTKDAEPANDAVPPVRRQEARDPICGMTVDVSKAKYKSEFRGDSFYFCCVGCKQTFDQQPDKCTLAAGQ